MKTLKVILKLLSGYRMANIFILIELCLTFFFLATMVNAYTDAFSYYSLFSDMKISNSIYFMGNIPIWVEDANAGDSPIQYAVDNTEKIRTYLEKQPEFEGTSNLVYAGVDLTGVIDKGSTGDLFAYDKKTAELFDSVWNLSDLYQIPVANGVIPCVVIDNSKSSSVFYKGLEFTTTISVFNSLSGDFTEKKVSLQVVRVINDSPFPAFYPTALTTGTPMNVKDLFTSDSNFTFFVPYSLEVFGEGVSNTSLIYLNENISQTRLNEIEKNLNAYGYLNTFSQMLDQTKNTAVAKLITNASLIVALTGMSLLTIISVAYLSAEKTYKRFSVYYLVGCPRWKSRVYYFFSLLALLLGSVAVYRACAFLFNLYYMNLDVHDRNIRLDVMYNIFGGSEAATVAIVLLCVAVMAISTLIHMRLMRKQQSTVDLYKERK